MKEFKLITIPEHTESKIFAVGCDNCKKMISTDDLFEIQEMHHIDFVGGYGSVFGDGNHIELDLCQQCLYNMLEPILKDQL